MHVRVLLGLKKSEDENVSVKIGQDENLQGVGFEDDSLSLPKILAQVWVLQVISPT